MAICHYLYLFLNNDLSRIQEASRWMAAEDIWEYHKGKKGTREISRELEAVFRYNLTPVEAVQAVLMNL